ncbi:hypothetical protein HDU98_012281 [Podochytrium sp. JEL0797]|nr:hypothetical protein HDU98_012281 [Podochytrium sp. JEL0797]
MQDAAATLEQSPDLTFPQCLPLLHEQCPQRNVPREKRVFTLTRRVQQKRRFQTVRLQIRSISELPKKKRTPIPLDKRELNTFTQDQIRVVLFQAVPFLVVKYHDVNAFLDDILHQERMLSLMDPDENEVDAATKEYSDIFNDAINMSRNTSPERAASIYQTRKSIHSSLPSRRNTAHDVAIPENSKINKIIPADFNLSRMLSSNLHNELQFARYQKIVTIILKQDGKLPVQPSQKKGVGRKAGRSRRKPHAFESMEPPVESKGIALGLYRPGEAVQGWKKLHYQSWVKSQEWAEATATAEAPNAISVKNTPDSNTSRKDSFMGFDSSRRGTLGNGTYIFQEGKLHPSDNHLPELMKFNSLNKIVSRPQLGKSNSTIRAPSMGSGSLNEKQYEISDFIFIRKVSQTHYSTIRQATLASIPAVRRKAYAMKTIMKQNLKTQALIETIYREREIHQRLASRFILKMMSTFQTPKRLYTLLEWCPTSLDGIMGFQRSLKEDQCRLVVAEVVLALEYLHKRNIIHRGLEPANIMLDSHGHVKLSDLSTSIVLSDSDRATSDIKCVRLTRYSAPELILGERHGKLVDWFSVGTILFEALTGNVPFGQGNVLDTLSAQYENYSVTRPAEDMVRRLMDPNHANRLSSLRGVIDIKSHPFFRPLNMSWKEIEEGKLKPAFVPGNEADDAIISEFLKNLNREEAPVAIPKFGRSQNSNTASKTAVTIADDDDYVIIEDGVKEELDPFLNETEITALIHETFTNW